MKEIPSIVAIVEGDGELYALPGLLRRILWHRLYRYDIAIRKTIAANGKPDLLKKFEAYLEYALLEDCDAILVLVDADEECPFQQAPNLSARAAALNLGVPVAIVYAKSEYETWFICSLSEFTGAPIRDRLGISESVDAPQNAENIRAAKGWLEQYMPNDRGYKETEDQEPLSHHIDLDLTYKTSRSFRRLCHAVDELVYAIDHGTKVVSP